MRSSSETQFTFNYYNQTSLFLTWWNQSKALKLYKCLRYWQWNMSEKRDWDFLITTCPWCSWYQWQRYGSSIALYNILIHTLVCFTGSSLTCLWFPVSASSSPLMSVTMAGLAPPPQRKPLVTLAPHPTPALPSSGAVTFTVAQPKPQQVPPNQTELYRRFMGTSKVGSCNIGT